MKRSRPYRRTPLKSSGRIRPKKRTPAEFDRVYGGPDRVAWNARQKCIVCGGTPCQAAHITNGGMGRKADASQTVPLCATCHRFQHQKGWFLLLATNNVDKIAHWLSAKAADTEARWQAYRTRMA